MKYPIHPLSAAMPAPSESDFKVLKESIDKHGQRVPAVLLNGSVLDGASRQRACEELGVALITRNYDPQKDGPSPAAFVADMNINRRHLTASQKAAAAAELLPFFRDEAEERKKSGKKAEAPERATEAAGKAAGVSARLVSDAASVKEKDPEAHEDVKAGKKTVGQAKKEVDSKPPEEDPEREALSNQHFEALKETLGAEFAEAVEAGTVLKSKKDLEDFTTLNAPDQKRIRALVVKGWSTKKALNFINDELKRADPISDLFIRTLSTGKKKASFTLSGWKITVEKTSETAEE